MSDHVIRISRESLAKLTAIRREPKFYARSLYPGAPDEVTRLDAERAVNLMLDRLITGLYKSPSKAFVLSEFQAMLDACQEYDSEEKEEVCEYCEQVMLALDIPSSEGLLSRWLYGVGPDAG